MVDYRKIDFNKEVKIMMIARIYGLVWLLAAAAAVGGYLTGFSNELTLTIFGFVFTTLAFLGVIAVLPALMKDHYSTSR